MATPNLCIIQVILSGEGQIVGSTQLVPSAQEYADKYRRLADLPAEQRRQDPDFQYMLSRRDFRIPVMNRGARAEFRFLVTRPLGVSVPTLLLSCDHRGVKLVNHPSQEMLWGVPRIRATVIGLVEAGLVAGVAGVTIASPLWASVLGFVLGAFCLGLGVLSLKLSRFVRSIF